jgi:DNA-binding beta-propeller fold protein YncE
VEATISLVAGRGVAGYLGDGGPATLAQLNGPTGVAVDAAGGVLIVDASNRVRRIASGTITTIAGSGVAGHVSEGLPLPEDGGPATAANLQYPTGVALDRDGNVFIADAANHRIRRIDLEGTITTVAGTGASGFAGDGGPATEARLHRPTGVAVSRKGEL